MPSLRVPVGIARAQPPSTELRVGLLSIYQV